MHQSYDSFDENQVERWPESPRAGSITEEDKTRIMGHIEDLFGILPSGTAYACPCSGPVTEEDKNLILWNIDELFPV